MKKSTTLAALVLAAASLAAQSLIDDFEPGSPSLPWGPMGQNAVLNGSFSIVPNPDPAGNPSSRCGQYQKGVSPFSALAIEAVGAVDLSEKTRFELAVRCPPGAKTVALQLFSPSIGSKEIVRQIDSTEKWRRLEFDFYAFQNVADWSGLRLLFDAGTTEPGKTWLIDDFLQTASTADPCQGVAPIQNIVDDFECQRNRSYSAGAAQLSAIANPMAGPIDPTLRAGRYADLAGPGDALSIEFPDGIDLQNFGVFELFVMPPTVGLPIIFRIEGGSSPAFEAPVFISSTTTWAKVEVDFSSKAGGDYRRLSIFFNHGQAPATVWHLDELRWVRASYSGCAASFESPELSLPTWGFFQNGSVPPSQGFQIVENPSKTGLNLSQNVGKAIEAGASSGATQTWGGMFADLDAPIRFTGAKKMRMKVLMPAAPRKATMKLEGSLTGAPATADNNLTVAVAGQWQQLEWDFSSISPNADYARLTLIWNIDAIPATDQTYYFDDIEVGTSGACSTVSTEAEPLAGQFFAIWPNPATETVQIKSSAETVRFEVFEASGHRAASFFSSDGSRQFFDVSRLKSGVFWAVGFDSAGRPTGQARFVKMAP